MKTLKYIRPNHIVCWFSLLFKKNNILTGEKGYHMQALVSTAVGVGTSKMILSFEIGPYKGLSLKF